MEHGLDTGVIAVVAASALLWSLVSARLERFDISAPMAFVVLGLVFTHGPLALTDVHLRSSTARSLAEITLALVLFVDASRINVRELRADTGLPVRLLGIGLPLTIGLGCVVAAVLYRDTGLWVAAAIGAAVAPTDAALGAPIVQDTRVPARIRRVLNVESGLNDGIATPFVGIFLAGAAASESVHGANGVGAAVVDLLGGAGIGIAIGIGGARLLRAAVARGLSAPRSAHWRRWRWRCWPTPAPSRWAANGFVAAFLAGMAFGSLLPSELEPTIAFADVAGEVLSLLMWFVVGAAMLVPAFQHAQWQDVVFAVLALTVIRMVPVAIACFGSGLDRRTVAFIGWFGPRGLASVIFALLAVDTLDVRDGNRVLTAVTVTVVLSVLAHGVTASPLAARYGAAVSTLHSQRPEQAPTPDLPPRSRTGNGRHGRWSTRRQR